MKLTAERNHYKLSQMVILEIDDCELANLPAGFAAVVEWRSEGITISQRLEILSRAAREIEEAQARRHLVIEYTGAYAHHMVIIAGEPIAFGEFVTVREDGRVYGATQQQIDADPPLVLGRCVSDRRESGREGESVVISLIHYVGDGGRLA